MQAGPADEDRTQSGVTEVGTPTASSAVVGMRSNLTISLNGHVLPPSLTILQAVRSFAAQSEAAPPEMGASPIPDLLQHLAGSSQTYTLT
jgi:hypothetical protein